MGRKGCAVCINYARSRLVGLAAAARSVLLREGELASAAAASAPPAKSHSQLYARIKPAEIEHSAIFPSEKMLLSPH
jgi:hypothetical protein